MTSKFYKKFSIPHNDLMKANMDGPINAFPPIINGHENNFYTLFKNTPQSYKDEIEDIYFGKAFYYEFGGTKRRYGDVMGKEASDIQIDNLFKIKEEFGIEPSLTLNQETHPVEILLDDDIRNQFISWLRTFYDRGLRICTIHNVHLMGTGILQKEFPEMKWKNSVNHIVRTPQELIDMHALGYDKILLDRSLNRNIQELRRISKVARERGIETSLLVSEGCMPSCPFKKEHDSVQPWIGGAEGSYWDSMGQISCNKWRGLQRNGERLPRVGVSCVWDTNDRFDLYNDLVDNFKFSGRLAGDKDKVLDTSFLTWAYVDGSNQFSAYCFEDIYNSNNGMLSNWFSQSYVNVDDPTKFITDDKMLESSIDYFNNLVHPYKSEIGVKMCKALVNCRNQCYKCHLCEDAFEVEHIDSLVEVNRFDNTNFKKVEI